MQAICTKVRSARITINKLADTNNSILDNEQTEDIQHILNAFDLLEQRLPILDTTLTTKNDRMTALHDLTTPLNAIIGYLFILKQEYTAPLTDSQRYSIQSVETQIHELHQLFSDQLLTSPPNN